MTSLHSTRRTPDKSWKVLRYLEHKMRCNSSARSLQCREVRPKPALVPCHPTAQTVQERHNPRCRQSPPRALASYCTAVLSSLPLCHCTSPPTTTSSQELGPPNPHPASLRLLLLFFPLPDDFSFLTSPRRSPTRLFSLPCPPPYPGIEANSLLWLSQFAFSRFLEPHGGEWWPALPYVDGEKNSAQQGLSTSELDLALWLWHLPAHGKERRKGGAAWINVTLPVLDFQQSQQSRLHSTFHSSPKIRDHDSGTTPTESRTHRLRRGYRDISPSFLLISSTLLHFAPDKTCSPRPTNGPPRKRQTRPPNIPILHLHPHSP